MRHTAIVQGDEELIRRTDRLATVERTSLNTSKLTSPK